MLLSLPSVADPGVINDEDFLLFLAASEDNQEKNEIITTDPLSMVEQTREEQFNNEQTYKEHKYDE